MASTKAKTLPNVNATQTEAQCLNCSIKPCAFPIKFNCSHTMCSSCLNHDLITTLFKSIENKQDILFSCKCHSGTSQMPFEEYIVIMKELTSERGKGKCRKHNGDGSKYCVECELWLCEQCISIHSEFNSHHKLSDKELPIKQVCQEHGEATRFYCNICKCEICASCVLKGGKHRDHKYFDLDQFTLLINEVKMKFKHKTADAFIAFFDSLCSEILLEIDSSVDTTIAKFDAIYAQLEIAKNDYLSQMETHKAKAKEVFEIIKYSYVYFYQELNRHYQDSHTLTYLNKIIELSSIRAYYTETPELDKVIEDISAFGSLKYFRYQINNNESPYPFEQTHIENLRRAQAGASLTSSAAMKKASTRKDFKLEGKVSDFNDFVYSIVKFRNDNVMAIGAGKDILVYEDILNKKDEKYCLLGHSKAVLCLAQLNEDKIVSGSEDKTIKVWNVRKRECSATITGKFEMITALTKLSTGMIAAGSHSTIRVFNPETKEELFTLVGHERSVSAIVQLSNALLLSGSYDYMIKIWDLNAKVCHYTLFGHDHTVYCLALLKDGRLASGSGSWEKTIKVWNIKQRSSEFNLIGHQREVRALIQLKSGLLISGSMDKTIKVWSLPHRNCIQTLSIHEDVIFCLELIDDERFASGSRDKSVCLWKHVSS